MESGWHLSKREVRARRGVVVAKHPLAARAGLEMFRKGGNAIDAGVAAAFAAGVVEPWMSGLGGCGMLVLRRGGPSAPPPVAIEFGSRAPGAAHAAMFTLDDGHDPEAYGWRRVRERANVHGPLAVAVPGVPAGLTHALEEFGTLPLSDVLAPAIALARDGFPVEWPTTLAVAMDAATLRRYPAAAALFLDDGLPPVPAAAARPRLLRQPELADTLAALAAGGEEAFYRGEIARRIVEEVRRAGGIVTADDFARYRPVVGPAFVYRGRGYDVAVVPGPTGGPTLVEMLGILRDDPLPSLGHNTAEYLHLLVEAMRAAFADRLALLGAGPEWTGLVGADHAARRRAQISPHRAGAWGSAGEPGQTSTTQVCAADREGNAISITQTLLSRFGSRFLVPGAGVLLNNGMMRFNPEPGHPNSIAPHQGSVANMTPILVFRAGRAPAAVGASGGRRIIGAVLQVMLNIVTFGMGAQDAVAAPRIDATGREVLVDRRIADATIEGLRLRGHALAVVEEAVEPRFFASPLALTDDPRTGDLLGGADPYHPASAAGW